MSSCGRRRNRASRFRAPTAGQSPMLLRAAARRRSFVPPTALAPSVRKLSRPRGAFNRRYARGGASGTRSALRLLQRPGAPTRIRHARRGSGPRGGRPDVGWRPGNDRSRRWFHLGGRSLERIIGRLQGDDQILRFARLTPGGMARIASSFPAGFPDAAGRMRNTSMQLFATPVAEDNRRCWSLSSRRIALASLMPATTVNRAVLSGIRDCSVRLASTGDELEPVMDAPSFPQPMYEALRDYRQDTLFPGLEQVPPDTVQLLQTNSAFIEAFMVGLNHEMARELLWREYPTDQRGTLLPAVLGRGVCRRRPARHSADP